LGEFVRRFLDPVNLVMLYLLAVVVIAVRYGRGPAVWGSIVSVLTFDFIFVPPHFTFAVSDSEYLLTFAGLLIVGLVISTLAARERERAIEARQRELRMTALYHLSRDLTSAVTPEAVVETLGAHLCHLLNHPMALFLPEEGVLRVRYCSPDFNVGEHEIAVATLAFQNGRSAGFGTQTLPAMKALYLPLKTRQNPLGVLAVDFGQSSDGLEEEEIELLNALTSQAALAIERALLSDQARQIEILKETDKLQKILLNSVSHDLKTPLVTITGVLGNLLENPVPDDQSRRELIETAYEESRRLNQIVGNLMDMTRVEAGALKISLTLCDVRDLIGAALQQFSKERISTRPVETHIAQDLPEVPMDFSLIMKVLVNLIDNALLYSSPETSLTITARTDGERLKIEVVDQGMGIPPKDKSRIFEKFYRSEHTQKIKGSGLGLAICKGIIEAHRGEIWAESRVGQGTTMIVSLPLRLPEGKG
jgi:two-component system sensor histidine kinase KdpD